MSQDTLTVQELTWQPDQSQVEVLNSICIEFIQGGFYGVLGPNGSGKTSLMRHILRLLNTKQGQVMLREKGVNSYSRKELAREIALVPQNTNIETNFTAYDIVMMGRAPHQGRFDGTSKQDKDIVLQAMEMTNCYHLKNQIFSMLSGGEAQRVVTARAIAQQTPWLILDEPIAHLDIRYQIELMKHLQYLNQEKQTSILAVLHDINLASEYCKQIVLMKQGKIVANGETKKVLTAEQLEKVYEIEFMVMERPDGKGAYFVPR